MSKQANRPRLGRGLSALISMPAEESAAQVMREVANATPESNVQPVDAVPWRMISLAEITPNPHQPRRSMDETALSDLAASLKANGLIQPIVVRQAESGYQLIAGERRFRAAKIAGLEQIPAIVREVDGYTQAQLALVENIHRSDLNAIDRAAAYGSLMNQLGLTQAELATRLGEQRSSVANYLRLLELAPPVQELVRVEKLSLGHAKVLAGVTDAVEQVRLAELCVAQDLSVRNLERLLEAAPSAVVAQKAPEAPSAHIRDLEANLSRQLGLRVQVAGKKGKGRVVIHYGSLDQFDDLVRRLGVELETM